MKICPKCKIAGKFGKNAARADGLSSWCNECRRKHIKPNITKRKLSKRKYNASAKGKAKTREYNVAVSVLKLKAHKRTWAGRFSNGKYTAKIRNLEWLFDLKTFEELANRPCFYCGDEPNAESTGVGLDRIDNTKGYTPTNVIACCKRCNYVRSNTFTIEETKVMIQSLLLYRQAQARSGEDR